MSDLSPYRNFCSLGDLCQLIGGGTPSKKNEDFYKGDIPWATVRDMKHDVITRTQFKITEDAVKNSSTNIIKADNVVIATRVGLGKICLIDQDTAINQDLRGVVPKNTEVLTVRYLFWWLKSVAHRIEQEGTGATVKGVKLPFIKSLQIPLPSLLEQKRIVTILDETFAGIDQAIANTEKNLVNAHQLFESTLNSTFPQQNKDWKNNPLQNIASVISGYSFKSGDFSIHNTLKSIKIANVGVRKFVTCQTNYLPENFLGQYDKFQAPMGSIAIALTRSIISNGLKMAIVPPWYDQALLNQRVAGVTANQNVILPTHIERVQLYEV